MRRLMFFVLLLCFAVVGISVLYRLAVVFQNYINPGEGLIVHAPQPQRLPTGSVAAFNLTGSGFDRETQISLVMDVSNQDMVINRYPLDGFFNTSLIIDDYLLLGSNDGLKLLSIADPASPRLLETYLPGRSVVDLHYADGLIFASCGRLGLAILTLQNSQMLIKAEVWTGDTTTTSYFHQGYLYVNTYAGGLLVYTLTESMQVRQVGELRHDSIIRGMVFHEDRLFVYDRYGMLYQYDCRNPSQLRRINQLRFESAVRSVLVKNAMLYVALADSFRAYDLVDPDQPDLVGIWEGFGSISRQVEGQHHIYLIDRSVGLRIFDTRDHTLTELKAFAEGLQTMAENSGFLYATGTLDGLLTIDRQHLRSRQVVAWVEGVARVNEALIRDDVLYLMTAAGAIYVEKEEGRATSFPGIDSRSASVAHYGDLLFVAQAAGGIKVFDVTVPDRPQPLAHWPDHSANRLRVVGDYLVSSSPNTGLMVTAVADVGAAHVVDQVSAPQILAMVTEGEYLFCVAFDHGLQVYRVRHDGTLESLGQVLPPFPADQFDQQVDIDVKDGIAYIANGRSGLLIVDVTNPAKPQVVSALGLPGYSKGIRFHQGRVYLVTLRDGIFVVDVAETARPLLVGSLPLSRLSRYLLIDKDLLYFFQDASGMSAIPLPQFDQQRRLHSRNHLEVTMPTPLYPGRYSVQVSNRRGLVSHHAVFEFY